MSRVNDSNGGAQLFTDLIEEFLLNVLKFSFLCEPLVNLSISFDIACIVYTFEERNCLLATLN